MAMTRTASTTKFNEPRQAAEMPNDFGERCDAKFNLFMNESEDRDFFDVAVAGMNIEAVNSMKAILAEKKLYEASVKMLSAAFVPEIGILEHIIDNATKAKDALELALQHQYTHCLFDEGLYDHSYVGILLEEKVKELDIEERVRARMINEQRMHD